MRWTENSVFSLNGAVGVGDILQFTRLPEYFYRDFKRDFKLLLPGDLFGFFNTIKHVKFVNRVLDHEVLRYCWKDASTIRPDGSPPYKAVAQYTDINDKNLKPIIDNAHSHEKYKAQVETIKKRNKPIVALVLKGTSNTFKFNNGHVPGLTSEIPDEIVSNIIYELADTHRFVLLGIKDYVTSISAEDFRNNGRSIFETFDLLQYCSYYIGVNTGLMHLAACIPNIKICMYTQTPIKYPIWENDVNKYHAFAWLYNDSTYWGHRDMADNVLSPHRFIEWMKNDLHRR
jgi:hypothetical protein